MAWDLAGGPASLSDTFVSSMRHRRGVGLRLHTFGFVPSIPRTLNINHKVVKSVCVRL